MLKKSIIPIYILDYKYWAHELQIQNNLVNTLKQFKNKLF